MQYNTEEADELERSYLLLADMYIQSNKNDLAQELCRRCVSDVATSKDEGLGFGDFARLFLSLAFPEFGANPIKASVMWRV
jgi:hypothetical protein